MSTNTNTINGTDKVIMVECASCEEKYDANLLDNDQNEAFGEKKFCSVCQDVLILFDDGTFALLDKVMQGIYPEVTTEDGDTFLLLESHEDGEERTKKYWENMMKNDAEEFCQLVGHETIVNLATGKRDREEFLSDLVSEDFGNRYCETGRKVVYFGVYAEDELGFVPVVQYEEG